MSEKPCSVKWCGAMASGGGYCAIHAKRQEFEPEQLSAPSAYAPCDYCEGSGFAIYGCCEVCDGKGKVLKAEPSHAD